MSLDPPTYLSSLQNNIRARPIPWDGAVRAGTISDNQLSKIRAVDKVRKEQRKQTIEADLNGYRTLFAGGEGQPSVLESAAKRADVVQYILVLLGDLIDGGNTTISSVGICRTDEGSQGSQHSQRLCMSTPIHTNPFFTSSSNQTTPKIPSPCLRPRSSRV